MNLPLFYDVDISKPLQPVPLQQMLVSGDALANRIGVRLFSGTAPYAPGGACAGLVLRADGSTVPVPGTIQNNELFIDLPAAAYAIPGPVTISLLNTSGSAVTTLFLGIGAVSRSQSGAVIDPGSVIPSVSALIRQIENAVESIPADYSDLLEAVAPAFSPSAAYSAGDHVWHAGKLYRATSAIPAGGAVTPDANCVQAALGAEIAEAQRALDVLAPSAADSDIGKALIVKTVSGGKATSYAFGETGGEIDDAAGYGDTDKVWSASKDANEVDAIKSNFSDMITILEGYDFPHAVITENRFANYSSKTIAQLAGVSVAEFDVSAIRRFKYNYTVTPPDQRGLYFTDRNGAALSNGCQTLSTVQDITVPPGAAKCYATINTIEDIIVYDIVAAKGEEILRGQAAYQDRTSGGITYTWNNDHTKCTVAGTRTGTNFHKLAGSSSSLPAGMAAGGKYKFVFQPVDQNIVMTLTLYANGTNVMQKIIRTTQVDTIPSGITGIEIRLQVTGANSVVNETVDCPEIYTIPEFRSFSERIADLENAAYSGSDNPLAYIRRDAGLLSIFHTVGCIGDSLASGACAYKESGVTHFVDLKPFSWGQCLARLTGNTYYNFSKGGLSAKTWLTSTCAAECFDGNHKCDAYFIGLGQNDKNQSLSVGTAADISLADYTQNADTYCGNMGRIIQMVREHQPKAPIFVFTDPNPPGGDQSYNAVIPDIAALFSNVWIIDLKTYAMQMFTESSHLIGSQYRGGHYSALGYQQIACVIATYTDWIIRRHLSAFSQVEFTGTGYEWTA